MDYVHFKINDSLGLLLMQIAQEHLILNYCPEKAISTFTDSLGCDERFAINVLKGDIVLFANVDEQVIEGFQRLEVHEGYFPKFNYLDWILRQCKEMTNFVEAFNDSKFFYEQSYDVSIDYDSVIKYAFGNDKSAIDDLVYGEFDEIVRFVIIAKQFIEKSLKLIDTINWIKRTFLIDVSINNEISALMAFIDRFKSLNELRYLKPTENDAVNLFINATIENDKILENGIQSVNILDNYDAGWLSPDGAYYALNGEIANMLHSTIATALVTSGIINVNVDDENPDSWLEQNGWVRIHGNNVQFAGCLNNKIGLPNVDITDTQIRVIANYIKRCHKSIVSLGWKRTRISAARFEMIAEKRQLLYKDFFNFD